MLRVRERRMSDMSRAGSLAGRPPWKSKSDEPPNITPSIPLRNSSGVLHASRSSSAERNEMSAVPPSAERKCVCSPAMRDSSVRDWTTSIRFISLYTKVYAIKFPPVGKGTPPARIRRRPYNSGTDVQLVVQSLPLRPRLLSPVRASAPRAIRSLPHRIRPLRRLFLARFFLCERGRILRERLFSLVLRAIGPPGTIEGHCDPWLRVYTKSTFTQKDAPPASIAGGVEFVERSRPNHQSFPEQFTQGTQVGFGRRDERVRVGNLRRHRSAINRKTDVHLGLRFGLRLRFNHVDLVELELSVVGYRDPDGVENRVDDAILGVCKTVDLFSVNHERDVCPRLFAGRIGCCLEPVQLDTVVRSRYLLIDQGLDVFVVDLLLAGGQSFEPDHDVGEFVVANLIAQFPKLQTHRSTAGVFAHHERLRARAHALGRHDLLQSSFDHAVLMDTGLMRERIAADDCLVVLHGERRHGRHELRGPRHHRTFDSRPESQHILPDTHCHDDGFERRVAGTFSDAVYRTLNLSCPGTHARQRVGGGHVEVVVTMDRKPYFVRIRHALAHRLEHRVIVLGGGVAQRIGQVDSCSSCLDSGPHAPAQKIDFRARARAEFGQST